MMSRIVVKIYFLYFNSTFVNVLDSPQERSSFPLIQPRVPPLWQPSSWIIIIYSNNKKNNNNNNNDNNNNGDKNNDDKNDNNSNNRNNNKNGNNVNNINSNIVLDWRKIL